MGKLNQMSPIYLAVALMSEEGMRLMTSASAWECRLPLQSRVGARQDTPGSR